jgi:imidazole glycerol phosphate synthase subunit HisF
MLMKKNWDHLERLTGKLLKKLSVPLIFKIGAHDNEDILPAFIFLKELGIKIFHINITSCLQDSRGMKFLDSLDKEEIFIIAGGGISDINGVKRILEQGADAAAIGNAAIRDPDIIRKIQSEL